MTFNLEHSIAIRWRLIFAVISYILLFASAFASKETRFDGLWTIFHSTSDLDPTAPERFMITRDFQGKSFSQLSIICENKQPFPMIEVSSPVIARGLGAVAFVLERHRFDNESIVKGVWKTGPTGLVGSVERDFNVAFVSGLLKARTLTIRIDTIEDTLPVEGLTGDTQIMEICGLQ